MAMHRLYDPALACHESFLTDFHHGLLGKRGGVQADSADDADYRNGAAVFTTSKGGLMFEASVGGQKFSFEPHPKT